MQCYCLCCCVIRLLGIRIHSSRGKWLLGPSDMSDPHTRHRLIRKRICSSYSHLSLPTDHTTPSYRLQPWPGHTLLPSAPRQQPPQPRRADRGGQVAVDVSIQVLGRIDRQNDYNYIPKVMLDEPGGRGHIRISLDSRLVRSFEGGATLLRPLNHLSGRRPLTPPPGPVRVQPSQVVLDAQTLIDRSRDLQLEREKRFLRRIRPNPLVLPDLWRVRPSPTEEQLAAFSATCLGQPMLAHPEVRTLEISLDEARRKLKDSSHNKTPRPVGTLVAELKCRSKKPRHVPDHLLVVTSSLAPSSSHPDILSLCSLREGLQRLRDKGDKRVK